MTATTLDATAAATANAREILRHVCPLCVAREPSEMTPAAGHPATDDLRGLAARLKGEMNWLSPSHKLRKGDLDRMDAELSCPGLRDGAPCLGHRDPPPRACRRAPGAGEPCSRRLITARTPEQKAPPPRRDPCRSDGPPGAKSGTLSPPPENRRTTPVCVIPYPTHTLRTAASLPPGIFLDRHHTPAGRRLRY